MTHLLGLDMPFSLLCRNCRINFCLVGFPRAQLFFCSSTSLIPLECTNFRVSLVCSSYDSTYVVTIYYVHYLLASSNILCFLSFVVIGSLIPDLSKSCCDNRHDYFVDQGLRFLSQNFLLMSILFGAETALVPIY